MCKFVCFVELFMYMDLKVIGFGRCLQHVLTTLRILYCFVYISFQILPCKKCHKKINILACIFTNGTFLNLGH